MFVKNGETLFSIVYDDFFITIDGFNIDKEHHYDVPDFSDVIDNHKYCFELKDLGNKNLNDVAKKINTNNVNCKNIHILEGGKDFAVNSEEELENTLKNYPKEQWTRIYFSDGNVVLTNNRACNLGIVRLNNKIYTHDCMDIQNKEFWYPVEVLCDKKINCGFCTIYQFFDNENNSLDDIINKRAEEYKSKYDYVKLPAKEGEDERYIPIKRIEISTATATVSPNKKIADTSDSTSLLGCLTAFAGVTTIFLFKKRAM